MTTHTTPTPPADPSGAALAQPAGGGDPRLDPARVLQRGPGSRAMRRVLGNSSFIFAGTIFGLIVFMAVFAPCWHPTTPMRRTSPSA